jgi:hypothetical protein
MEIPPSPARSKSDDTVIFTDITPTCLDEKDAIERCVEGLKYAASQARELNARQPNLGWNSVRESLTAMVKSVRTLATQKAKTRQDTVKMLDDMSKKLETGDAA